MTLVTSKQLLLDAKIGNYAVPAFNIENMEMAMAVLNKANEMKSPVILQTTPSTVKYASLSLFYSIVKALSEQVNIPVVLHLDHGNSFELANQALKSGYTSIMIDGSHYDFEENITKSVVDAAKTYDRPVEGELGTVGGKEDDLDVKESSKFTDPIQAAEFVKRTGVDSLAVAIGTAHGFYKSEPNIDVNRVKQICDIVDVPLVMHGTTGVSGEIVQQCIKSGICKVNYATELRAAYSKGVKNTITNNPDVYDPKEYGREAIKEVEKIVEKNIIICFSQDKA